MYFSPTRTTRRIASGIAEVVSDEICPDKVPAHRNRAYGMVKAREKCGLKGLHLRELSTETPTVPGCVALKAAVDVAHPISVPQCYNPGMKQFFLTLPRNIIGCFGGRRILWHAVAIILTLILVTSGFDWSYFLSTRAPVLRSWMFPAVAMGGLLPIVLPLLLLAIGLLAGSNRIRLTGWAVGQGELIGALVAAFYKAFTGRVHPPRSAGADLSHVFQFGLLRGGVFWGWPSSHTTVAFAMAVTIFTLWPKQRWLGTIAIIYAFYIGIGVSMTIHWCSDFLAGAIFGTVIGMVAGKSFLLSQLRAITPSSQEQTMQLPQG